MREREIKARTWLDSPVEPVPLIPCPETLPEFFPSESCTCWPHRHGAQPRGGLYRKLAAELFKIVL
jgi:hypothetical protein